MPTEQNTNLTPASGFSQLATFQMEDMAEELNGLEGGFDRIKIPSGGMTVFEMPGETEDSPETVKEFSAVILHHHPTTGRNTQAAAILRTAAATTA